MARDWKTTYTAASASATHTAPLPQVAAAGRRLVAIAAAPATIATPAGWTEVADPLGDLELAAAIKTAAGGEASVVWEREPLTSTAPRTLAGWIESRDDIGDVDGTPVAVAAASSGAGGSVTVTVTTTVAGARIYLAVSEMNPATEWTPIPPGLLAVDDAITAPGLSNESVRLAVCSGIAATAGTHTLTVGLPVQRTFQVVAFALTPPGGGTPPPAAETAVEAENRLAGSTGWDITGIGSTTIQGYATAMSVARGGTLQLKVHSPAASWSGTVYRLGYYGGVGARQIATISGAQTTQPSGTVDATTLMTSCANWTANGSWAVPADAPAGVYIIKIARTDNTALASHVGPFVVTDPTRKAKIAVKLSDSTWAAYNHAGANPADILAGRSIYGVGSTGGFTFDQAQRARAVSYDRPFVTRQHLPQTFIWNAEYPLIRWLERLGYDVDYLTCVMVDADPSLLLGRKTVISSGHDEYWSEGMHAAHISARDHATLSSHALYLSGNEAFWKIRWDPDRRAYACWKDTHDNALNPTGLYSGTWQDTRSFNPDRRPPALLNGQRFKLNGISAYALRASAIHAGLPLWRNTAVAALTGSSTWSSAVGIVGFEADEPADMIPSDAPAGLVRLSQATYTVTGLLSDVDGNTYTGSGAYTHAMTGYRSTVTGAAVFAAGTVQYAWALDEVHDRHPGGTLVSPVLQQALTNLLADLGTIPPAYPLPSGLVLPTAVDLAGYGLPGPTAPEPEPTGPPVYASLTAVKLMLGKLTDDRDELIVQAIAAASRHIERRCGRRFYADSTATSRTFPIIGESLCAGPEQVLLVDDIASLQDLAVAVGGYGTWTPVQLWDPGPDNAAAYGHPYAEIRAMAGWLPASGRIQVTARWGWPSVPAEIAQATALLAARWYRRKDSPQGVLGSSEWGTARVSRTDPDVEALIGPFVIHAIA